MFTPSSHPTGTRQGLTARRSLTASATNNRPHCLYRRPASRQARKPANDRENPVRLLDGETPELSE